MFRVFEEMASEEDQMQALTPRGTLRSPELSGTPVLKGRSSYMPTLPGFHLDHAPVSVVSVEEKWEHSEFCDVGGGEAAAMQAEYDLCTWNPYASDERECGGERHEKEDKQSLAKPETENTCQQVLVDASFQKDHNLINQVWNSLPSFGNVTEKGRRKTGTSYPNQGHYNKAEQSDAAALQSRFTELFHKVAGFGPLEDDTVESSHTFRGQTQQILHFQKKIKELQVQLAEEKRQRQIAAQRLAEERQTTEKTSLEKQELWETKLKELQKEKYALSIRLQEVEAETPRKRIAKCDKTVLLTGQELKRLKQEICEQESLIKGYQIENQKAVESMKELELEAKEKQKLMAEENASLASQLANMQLSVRQSLNRGASVESSMRNVGLEAHARELKLRLENEKLLQIIADLERSVTEMNAKHQSDARCSTAEKVLVNEELASEKADLAKRVQEQAELISELETKLEKQQKILDSRPVSEPAPLVPENGQASSRRIKRVTEQVADVRSFYIRKIKELTRRLEEADQENKKKTDTEILKANAMSHAAQMKEMKQLKEQVKTQANTIKALNDKLLELEKVRETQDVCFERSSRELAPNMLNTKHKQREQRSSSRTNENTEVLEVDPHQETLQEAQFLRQERKKLEEKNHTLEERLKEVSQELADLQSTPRMLQLKFLKDRIEEMEEHHKQKEIEWQEIVKETKRMYGIEQDMVERKWELALDAKNAEVERFRLELDTILEAALKIQASQIQATKGDSKSFL